MAENDGQQQAQQATTNPDGEQQQTATEPAGLTQAQVDAIVEKRLARQQAQLTSQFTQQLQGLGFESLEALSETVAEQRQREAEAEQRRQERLQKDGKHAELLEIERKRVESLQRSSAEKIAALEREIAERDARAAAAKVRSKLLEAATSKKLHAPGQVADLLSRSVKVGEDGALYVMGEDGTPRMGQSGQLVTVEDLVAEFATSNPHFAPPAQGQGANSRPAGGPVVVNQVDLTNTDINYIRANQEAFERAALEGRLK